MIYDKLFDLFGVICVLYWLNFCLNICFFLFFCFPASYPVCSFFTIIISGWLLCTLTELSWKTLSILFLWFGKSFHALFFGCREQKSFFIF